jgi:hypothetical protein
MIVHLCRPSFPVKRASVVPFHKIICLAKLFPEQVVDFVWNGEILLQTMTFLFYHIMPRSSIVVLPDESREKAGHWLSVTGDTDAFNERIEFALNPKTRAEAARLRDARLWRVDQRGRAALKCIDMFEFNQPKCSGQHRAKLNVDSSASLCPSAEPLPVAW